MNLENITTWEVIAMLLTAVGATFLAWLIVHIAYRKSRREMRKHKFDK
ncbi:MAG: hypothetical protein JNM88_07730 [Chitinophagaceae bacterium]|nr:hypothetical protein [Chitinophagaceae bacterium]